MEFVKTYNGQKYYTVSIGTIMRSIPIVEVEEGIWIASDAELILGDVEFISKTAEILANKIKPLYPEVIVTPEAKSIALAYEVSKNLGHRKFVVARKSVKAYMKDYVVETFKAITTKETQTLVLVKEDLEYIRDKKVCLLDDVVSTGGTMEALESLVKKAGSKIVCKAAIWKEGPWYKKQDLIFLDILPIFVIENKLKEFL